MSVRSRNLLLLELLCAGVGAAAHASGQHMLFRLDKFAALPAKASPAAASAAPSDAATATEPTSTPAACAATASCW